MAKTNKPPTSPIGIPGEKEITPTPASDDINPVDVSDEAKDPIPPQAMDHRNEVEPGGPMGDGAS